MNGKSWEYTPYPEFSGIDQFTFRATDSQIQGNLATATIHIHEQNDAPVIQSSTFVMKEDEVLKIKLIASDPDGDSLSFEVIQKPTNGTLVETIRLLQRRTSLGTTPSLLKQVRRIGK